MKLLNATVLSLFLLESKRNKQYGSMVTPDTDRNASKTFVS